jgi:hypothetical protein
VRILVGVLGVLLSLPFVAVGVFQRNFPPSQQRAVGLAGLVSGVCFVIAAGSVFVSSWGRAGVVVLAFLGTVYVVLWTGHWFSRRAAAQDEKRGR